MKITAAIIVKNESKHIEEMLRSLEGIDEIIVCDTGSEDNTVELAKKYTDKVFTDYTWEDSFCKARNHVLNKVDEGWVLSIDADETLQSSVDDIRTAIKLADEKGFKTINCILVAKGTRQEHKFPRLFKRCPEVFWKGDIHNYLSVAEKSNSDITIEYGYSEAHKKDPGRALRILLKYTLEHPDCVREKYYLAREFFYKKDWKKAIHWYDEYIKVSKFLPEKADAMLYYARSLWQLQRGSEARDMCLKTIQQNPDFKEALVFMAEMHYSPWREKWLNLASVAQNSDVIFVRDIKPKVVSPMDLDLQHLLYMENVLLRKPKIDVLEWGAGTSTKYFTDFLKKHGIEYTWRSMEHQKAWYDRVKAMKPEGVELILADKDSEEYLDPEGQYDVIYVDGRNRAKCLENAKKMLKPDGIIILHDAQRERYHEAMKLYNGDYIFEGHPKLWRGFLGESKPLIPKIIHQIWIGDKERPSKWMDTWKMDGWEYKLWDEEEINKLNLNNNNIYQKYVSEKCYNGAANVARVEILERFGGVYIDADAVMVNKLDEAPFMDWDFFAVEAGDRNIYKSIRAGNGVIGCIPDHPIIKKYVEKIGELKEINPSFIASGPVLFSSLLDRKILPSYTFYPEHYSGKKAEIKGKIYSEHKWGTTKNLY